VAASPDFFLRARHHLNSRRLRLRGFRLVLLALGFLGLILLALGLGERLPGQEGVDILGQNLADLRAVADVRRLDDPLAVEQDDRRQSGYLERPTDRPRWIEPDLADGRARQVDLLLGQGVLNLLADVADFAGFLILAQGDDEEFLLFLRLAIGFDDL